MIQLLVCFQDQNVWILAAINKDLTGECETGNLRWDLYHRLAVTELQLPKLASRGQQEIDELFEYFLIHGNQSQTAEAISWVINTLRNKIEKYGIDVEQYK